MSIVVDRALPNRPRAISTDEHELVRVVLALVLRTTERCTGTGQKVRLYTPLRRGSWQMSRQVAADMTN